MATFANDNDIDPAKQFRAMPDEILITQDLVQQGAVHAVSFLLQHGCTEAAAAEMLASLRKNAGLIRAEASRRGINHFDHDQLAFS